MNGSRSDSRVRPASRSCARRALCAVVAVGFACLPVGAQAVFDPEQELAFERPEAWAHAFYSTVALPSGLGGPSELAPGSWELGFEAGQVPHLDTAQRTVGFNGTKTEDLNRTDAIGRVRATVGLEAGVAVTFAATPPVTVEGVRADLWSVAVSRGVVRTGPVRVGVRAYFQYGEIEGDLTCSADQVAAGDDRTLNPFGCTARSEDRLISRVVGAEATVAFPRAAGSVEPYLAASVQRLDTSFRVDAAYGGIVDRSRQEAYGVTWAAAGGIGVPFARRWRATVEMFWSPLDVVRPPETSERTDGVLNARAMVRYRFGR